jgi:hypothetical protein
MLKLVLAALVVMVSLSAVIACTPVQGNIFPPCGVTNGCNDGAGDSGNSGSH